MPLEPCYPVSTVGILTLVYDDNMNHGARFFKIVLPFVDSTRTPETQTSQGEILQSINDLAADRPLFSFLAVLYSVLSAHLSVIGKEGRSEVATWWTRSIQS